MQYGPGEGATRRFVQIRGEMGANMFKVPGWLRIRMGRSTEDLWDHSEAGLRRTDGEGVWNG